MEPNPLLIYTLRTTKQWEFSQIQEYLTKKGNKVSLNQINAMYQAECKRRGESPDLTEQVKEDHLQMSNKQAGAILRKILVEGKTLEEFKVLYELPVVPKEFKKAFLKLRFAAEHIKKIGEEWIQDEDLLTVLDYAEQKGDFEQTTMKYFSSNIPKGKLKNGQIDIIRKSDRFESRPSAFIYLFSRYQDRHPITFSKYDARIYQQLKKEFEHKIEWQQTRIEQAYTQENLRRVQSVIDLVEEPNL